jgi:hypothetical protein
MFGPWKLLSCCVSDNEAAIKKRAELYCQDARLPTAKNGIKQITYIYSILGFIDSKASALMRFDGVILAVLALLYRSNLTSDAGTTTGNWVDKPVAVSVILLFASITSCILVIDISWRFLSIACPEKGADNLDGELKELRKVLKFREGTYKLAWLLSLLALLAMFITTIIFLWHHFIT